MANEEKNKENENTNSKRIKNSWKLILAKMSIRKKYIMPIVSIIGASHSNNTQ